MGFSRIWKFGRNSRGLSQNVWQPRHHTASRTRRAVRGITLARRRTALAAAARSPGQIATVDPSVPTRPEPRRGILRSTDHAVRTAVASRQAIPRSRVPLAGIRISDTSGNATARWPEASACGGSTTIEGRPAVWRYNNPGIPDLPRSGRPAARRSSRQRSTGQECDAWNSCQNQGQIPPHRICRPDGTADQGVIRQRITFCPT